MGFFSAIELADPLGVQLIFNDEHGQSLCRRTFAFHPLPKVKLAVILHPMNMEYVLDGSKITSLETFYDEIDRVLLKGTSWGRNLDAFDDVLSGGFGTPAGGFTLRWADAEASRRHLGYPETVRQLEVRLNRCHPSNRDTVRRELERARGRDGPTVFDWLVDLIQQHGVGGDRGEDNVSLILD